MGKSSVLSIHQRAVLKGCRKHRESLVVECSGHWTTSEDTCGRDSRTELGVTTELGGGLSLPAPSSHPPTKTAPAFSETSLRLEIVIGAGRWMVMVMMCTLPLAEMVPRCPGIY
jgi:hypothetical protein